MGSAARLGRARAWRAARNAAGADACAAARAALRVLRERTHALSPFELAAFHDLVALTGSLVLGFAATGKAHDAEEIWALSRLDESFQAELWGEDEEATEAAEIKRDAFLHAHRFFALCGTA